MLERSWKLYYQMTQATNIEKLVDLLTELPNLSNEHIDEEIHQLFGEEVKKLGKAVYSTAVAARLQCVEEPVQPLQLVQSDPLDDLDLENRFFAGYFFCSLVYHAPKYEYNEF